jgi:peptide/nickel transport system permease protein
MHTERDDGDGIAKDGQTVLGDTDEASRPVGGRTLGFVVTAAAVVALFLYDLTQVPSDGQLIPAWRAKSVPGWDPTLIEWLFLLSLAVIAWSLLYPLARNRELTRRYWRRLRQDRRALASLAVVVAFYIVGIAGPALLDALRVVTGITGAAGARGVAPMQPPVGFTTPTSVTGGACVGEITDGMCHGTLRHPLGTNKKLQDVLVVTVAGAQSAVYAGTVAATIAAPIGVFVGTVSATVGGWVDELAMRYVDLQLVVPPFFAYLFLQVFFGRSFLVFVLLFGVLNWGSIARLVRSEALSKTDLGYVRASEDAGSSRLRTIRTHLLPNVSNTVVTSVTTMVPTVILVEVSLGYLQLSDPTYTSWGNLLSGWSRRGGAGAVVIDGFSFTTWWTEAIPVVAMLLVLVSFAVLGDTLRDVLDPRVEVEE